MGQSLYKLTFSFSLTRVLFLNFNISGVQIYSGKTNSVLVMSFISPSLSLPCSLLSCFACSGFIVGFFTFPLCILFFFQSQSFLILTSPLTFAPISSWSFCTSIILILVFSLSPSLSFSLSSFRVILADLPLIAFPPSLTFALFLSFLSCISHFQSRRHSNFQLSLIGSSKIISFSPCRP